MERLQPRALSVLVGLAALTIALAGLRGVAGIVGPAFLALVLIITVYPVRVWLVKHHVPGWLASVILLLSVYALMILVTLALVISVGRLAVLVPDYTPQINGYVTDVTAWLQDRGVGSDQVNAIKDSFDVGSLVGVATDILSGILGVLSDIFFIMTLLLFLAFDAAPTMKVVGTLADHKPDVVAGLASFASGTRSYMAVSAGFGFIVAVVDVGALLIIGVPGAFIWGVLAFVTNFIPNVGFVIGVVPPAVIALLDGGPGLMIAVVIIYSVINFVIQSVIQPRFVGDAVGLSATLTFISLVFWAWAVGPLGALLAVPLSLLFKALLVEADPDARWALPLISGKVPAAD
ncbi:AI-2E family transporter [Nocardioides marmoriginsengisoli]|uniref:AI-2E family transporter n=1 Tax=Nocardioides marmoriginsengisoli TaxID=661483 RepID=A0A3N0CKT3_9ACTN|nr:AI-2E family transporter [Nocardioides marmoriginsengisoli]RNL64068.1 AI-2E family transporter [Nocardioides marmoriginsengisoli]